MRMFEFLWFSMIGIFIIYLISDDIFFGLITLSFSILSLLVLIFDNKVKENKYAKTK